MTGRSYVGIDSTDNDEWIVVLLTEGKILASGPFRNTRSDLEALVRSISERCAKPKICLKPAKPSALKLIKHLGGIPDVEVVLMFDAGLRMHQTWLWKAMSPVVENESCQARLLAYCAARTV